MKALIKPCPDLLTRHALFILLLLAGINGFAQRPAVSTLVHSESSELLSDPSFVLPQNTSPNQLLLRKGDTLMIISRNNCKSGFTSYYLLEHTVPVAVITERKPYTITPAPAGKPFLKVSGNVQYDFLYRSFIDTPFSQNDYQQHTVQTFLNVTVKDKYPMKVNLSQRISNSFYFRDFIDMNVRFDKNAFVQTARRRALDKITSHYWQNTGLTMAEAALKQAVDRYNTVKAALNSPDVLQKMVEEREKEYYEKMKAAAEPPDTAILIMESIDTKRSRLLYKMESGKNIITGAKTGIDSSYSRYLENRKKELDSLEQKVYTLQAKTDSIKNRINNDVAALRRKIYKSTHTSDLKRIESENGIEGERREGFEKFLSNVKSIGIGRSMVNYSELTARDVALTGINIEYNDGIYAALAAGKIDYGFRDFLGKNTRQKGQNFLMGRIGWGDVDRKAVILSAFGGNKFNYGSIAPDSVDDRIRVAGYAIEGILKKDENTGLSIELAKTTIPVTGSLNSNSGMKPLFRFSDNANLGISVKGQTLLSGTNTRITGFYRKTGEQFQSFSLFTYNTDQTSWSVTVDQSLWKNKLSVITSLRRNDFTNPFSEKTFKTSTVFKSIQVNLRLPRWPVLSAGYYPGSQLYIIDKERIRENVYYILNGSLVHSYKVGRMRMLSSLLYNKYSGKGSDSGFIAYRGISYMASHAFMFSKLRLEGMYMYTDQEQMQYYTLDAGADYSFSSKLSAGAGIKYNKITGGSTYMGNNLHVRFELSKLGGLQLQYEKSYLPTIYQTLYAVESGRVSWFKYF